MELDEYDIERRETSVDPLDAFHEARVLEEDSAHPVQLGSIDTADNVMLYGGRRNGIRAPAPSHVGRCRISKDVK